MAFVPRTTLDLPAPKAKATRSTAASKASGFDFRDRLLRALQWSLLGAVLLSFIIGAAPSADTPEDWIGGDLADTSGHRTSIQASSDFILAAGDDKDDPTKGDWHENCFAEPDLKDHKEGIVDDPGCVKTVGKKSWTEPWHQFFSDTSNKEKLGSQTWSSRLLPLYRWDNATTTIFNNVAGNQMSNAQANSHAIINGGVMAVGNGEFSMTTTLARTASDFDFLDVAGYYVDLSFAKIGEMLLNGFVGLTVVAAIVIAAWRYYRRGGAGVSLFSLLLKPLILVVVFVVLTSGAQDTVKDGKTNDAKPGTGSPWWVGKTLTTSVETLADPVQGLVTETLEPFHPNSEDGYHEKVNSCWAQRQSMQDAYKHYAKKAGGNASTAQTISAMWENTGLMAWMTSQYGTDMDTYESRTYCRLLDDMGNIPANERYIAPLEDHDLKPKSTAPWGSYSDPQERSTNQFYWAACTLNDDDEWTVSGAWKRALDDKAKHVKCDDWYNKPYTSENLTGDDNVLTPSTEGQGEIDKQFKRDPGVNSFVQRFMGYDRGGFQTMTLFYLLAATLTTFAFGIVSVLILGAKVMLVVALIALIAAILKDVLPFAAASAVKETALTFVGATIVSVFASLIFIVVTMIASVLTAGGLAILGRGSLAAMLWTGFAPILAILVLHIMFKKWFKKPSPFTPSGAMAWAGGKPTGEAFGEGANALTGGGGSGGGGSGGRNPFSGGGKGSGDIPNSNRGLDGEDGMDPKGLGGPKTPALAGARGLGVGANGTGAPNDAANASIDDTLLPPRAPMSFDEAKAKREDDAIARKEAKADDKAMMKETKRARQFERKDAKQREGLLKANAKQQAGMGVAGAKSDAKDAKAALKSSHVSGLQRFKDAQAIRRDRRAAVDSHKEMKSHLLNTAGSAAIAGQQAYAAKADAGMSKASMAQQASAGVIDSATPEPVSVNHTNAGSDHDHQMDPRASENTRPDQFAEDQFIDAQKGKHFDDPYAGIPTTGDSLAGQTPEVGGPPAGQNQPSQPQVQSDSQPVPVPTPRPESTPVAQPAEPPRQQAREPFQPDSPVVGRPARSSMTPDSGDMPPKI